MKRFLNVVLVGAATTLAAQAFGQTAKPPAQPKPAPSPLKPVSTAPGAKPDPALNPYAGMRTTPRAAAAAVQRPVFVPPAAVIELDEIAVQPGLPQVLKDDDRDRYRRIFQAQARGNWGEADAEIAVLGSAGLDGLLAMRLGKLEKVKYTSIKPPHAWSGTPAETDFDLPSIKTPTVIFRGSPADAGRLYPKNANLAVTVALCGAGLDRTEIELVADPTLPEGCNASKLEVVSDSGELNMYRLGRAMPDNPKTGVLTALTMADDLMKIVRASDW